MSVKAIGFAEIDAGKRKRGATVSARNRNIEFETLKLILRYAVDRGIVLKNAAEKLKRRKQPKAIIELPSHAEFRSLVKTLREAPLAVASSATAMVEFLAYSGMRVGEAREVRFEDVNLDSRKRADYRRRAGHEESSRARHPAFSKPAKSSRAPDRRSRLNRHGRAHF